MGRNYADALCTECNESFQWLIGTSQICPDCRRKKAEQQAKRRARWQARRERKTRERSKWRSLAGKGYTIEDLGRPAIFLIPVSKLKQKMDDETNETVEENLQRFLLEHFGAYTSFLIPSFGFWKDAEKATIFDECREYEVSFLGKKRIPTLLKKLAEITIVIGEECIYIKAGQYAGLLRPSQESS